jgi:hypothetical protein
MGLALIPSREEKLIVSHGNLVDKANRESEDLVELEK